MAATTAPTQFHLFPKLPVELQLRIWHESVHQESPRVYELYDHDPVAGQASHLDFDYPSDSTDSDEAEEEGHTVVRPIKFHIADISLYERSVVFQRSFLEVNRTSRNETLQYYQRVKFLNAHVWINLDVDIFYLGNYRQESLNTCFRGLRYFWDPFWKTIKHMAFGMDEVHRTLLQGPGLVSFDQESALTDLAEQIQNFEALETLYIVLDSIKPTKRRVPRVNGAITFGDVYQLTSQRSQRGPKYHKRWMDFLREEWDTAVQENPDYNMPRLEVKTLSRGGRLQKWSTRRTGLPEWLHRVRRMRDRLLVEQDSSDSAIDPDGSELGDFESHDSDEEDGEDGGYGSDVYDDDSD